MAKLSKIETEILAGLNEKQKEAVTWKEGPLLIIAGAGTGKTKVITNRIAWLIAQKIAKPEEILGLTFTDKAANEMEERVDILVPYGWAPVEISTFHSFGQKILREYAFELGISPDFRVLSTPELLVFLREKLWELPLKYFRPLSYPTKYLKALLDVISRAKDEDISAQEYLEYAESKVGAIQELSLQSEEREEREKQIEIAECYNKYEELLRETDYMDMPGLITLVLKLLRDRKSVLRKLQNRYKYILVDEFQDTNYAQFQLLKLLVGNKSQKGEAETLHCKDASEGSHLPIVPGYIDGYQNLTVVGDDDQSIYKFRGACLANILSFKDMYPDAHTIVLTENYRSRQSILDAARRLIIFNNPERLEVKAGVDKSLKSHSSSPMAQVGQLGLFESEVKYQHYDSMGSEADAIANLIEERIARSDNSQGTSQKSDYKYSDFAILVRTNQLQDPFIRAFNLKGIPWKSAGNQGLYDRDEVQVLISVLGLVSDVGDTQSLYRVINSPAYKMPAIDLSECLGIVKRTNRSLYKVLKTEDQRPKTEDLSDEGKGVIKEFLQDLEHFMELSAKKSAGSVLYDFLSRTGWLKKLVSNPSLENELRIKNIAKFLSIIDKVSDIIHTNKVPFVREHIENLMELGENPPVAEADFDVDAVNILTVHKAKGLEFRVVVLVGLVADSFPHRRMPTLVELPIDLVKEPVPELEESPLRIQEERRLFYVGMTRAKEELIFTSARDYGGRRERKPSPFIMEALDLSKDEIVAQKKELKDRIEQFKETPNIEAIHELPLGKVLSLSSTAIDDWITCPRKYWYIRWLRVPIPKHHTIVYGFAVHKAIENYLLARKSGKKMKIEDVLQVFKNYWVSEGFISREHEEERFKRGEEVLRNFFEREETDGKMPAYVEESFSFLLEDVKVRGRWDRVDSGITNHKLQIINSEGENENSGGVITDYKTGEVKTKEKASQRVRNSVQLPIYALAYKEKFGGLPSKVEFYFVETDIRGELKEIDKKVEKVKETIKKVAQGVRKLDFEPRPRYRACEFCSCRVICDYGKKM